MMEESPSTNAVTRSSGTAAAHARTSAGATNDITRVGPPRDVFQAVIANNRSAAGYGTGLNRTPSTIAKTVAESAMLSAITTVTAAAYQGARRSERNACRTSRRGLNPRPNATSGRGAWRARRAAMLATMPDIAITCHARARAPVPDARRRRCSSKSPAIDSARSSLVSRRSRLRIMIRYPACGRRPTGSTALFAMPAAPPVPVWSRDNSAWLARPVPASDR